jgi:anti-sigma factor RsiW
MSEHLSAETIESYADGELPAASVPDAEEHLRECAVCAGKLVAQLQLKRSIREAAWTLPPDALRRRMTRRPRWPWAAALATAALLVVVFAIPRRTNELADFHTTILASANPVDVISTDRHTVKPWFEGKLPFSFPIPELGSTPFRLAGGRVVYLHEQPVAYLMVTKGAHKISMFVGRDVASPRGDAFQSLAWSSGGLRYVAIGDVAQSDLEALRDAFASAH